MPKTGLTKLLTFGEAMKPIPKLNLPKVREGGGQWNSYRKLTRPPPPEPAPVL